MDLSVGDIVWARRQKEDIYWPGKITVISNNTNDLWSTNVHSSYLVQFFCTNQSIWTMDVLPYRQCRESMANDSFLHYGLHPTIKQDFLNAIYEADHMINQQMFANPTLTVLTTPQEKITPMIEDNIDNDFLLTPAPIYPSNPEYYNSSIQSFDSFSTVNNSHRTTTANDWYNKQGLVVESITPPLPIEMTDHSDNCQKSTSIIILTTKSYSNSSFISFLINSFSNFSHHSIIYIDDPTTFLPNHPSISNVYYFICLDYFDETIKQTLDSTILNNLNVHINYLFLILNSPSNELIKHLYSTVMDRRAILVLHYHSTFDNEPLLLCSGNRTTFELIEKILSKYLCPKIKYIEAQNETDEEIYSAYCISSIVQSASILHHFVNEQIQEILNENFNEEFQRKNEHVMNELFSQLSINKSTNQDNLGNIIENSNTEIVTNSNKQSAILNDLFDNGAIRTRIPPPICEYYLQEYLQKK